MLVQRESQEARFWTPNRTNYECCSCMTTNVADDYERRSYMIAKVGIYVTTNVAVDYNCRSYMTTNVADMTTDVAVI